MVLFGVNQACTCVSRKLDILSPVMWSEFEKGFWYACTQLLGRYLRLKWVNNEVTTRMTRSTTLMMMLMMITTTTIMRRLLLLLSLSSSLSTRVPTVLKISGYSQILCFIFTQILTVLLHDKMLCLIHYTTLHLIFLSFALLLLCFVLLFVLNYVLPLLPGMPWN